MPHAMVDETFTNIDGRHAVDNIGGISQGDLERRKPDEDLTPEDNDNDMQHNEYDPLEEIHHIDDHSSDLRSYPVSNIIVDPRNESRLQAAMPNSDGHPTTPHSPNSPPDTVAIQSSPISPQSRIKNRRKAYLERNLQYFSSPDLELADPLLYDKCIRRFQSAAEREADGRAKGWSGVLEADLYRSEAKIAALRDAKPSSVGEDLSSTNSRMAVDGEGHDGETEQKQADEVEDAPTSKEDGLERWKYSMTMRFLHGLDPDFDYKEVDENEEFDEVEIREEQERWFEDEEPEWSSDHGSSGRTVAGETGVQDF